MFTTNRFKIVTTLLVTILCTGNANSAFIETSAGCQSSGTDTSASCDPAFQDNYSYSFNISDTANSSIFHATLTNTSSGSFTGALIDALAFNMNPGLQLGDGTNTDDQFNIIDISPDWSFTDAPSGAGIQFGYVGTDNTTPHSPDQRISSGKTLEFDFIFHDLSKLLSPGDDPFNLWLLSSDQTLGSGIGGGGDSGQVAVSFQQLGSTGDDSDLLTSNWAPGTNPSPGPGPTPTIPEPTSIFLIGTGLLGLFSASRKKS